MNGERKRERGGERERERKKERQRERERETILYHHSPFSSIIPPHINFM